MAKKVVFLGMGGTIAGRAADAADNVGYRAGEVSVEDLLQAVPGLVQVLGGFQTASEQVAQIDSKDICFDDMARLALRVREHVEDPAVQAIVVTHGTDTLEETAFFLESVLPGDLLAQKAVVLTCAMRPATALAPDGPGNLLDATHLALEPTARGILVSCAGVIHSALYVHKVHPYRLDAFSSGDAGPLGYMEEGRVRWVSGRGMALTHAGLEPTLLRNADWPRVEILLNHAQASGAMVRALCARPQAPDPMVRGLVVAGTGNGTLNDSLEEALVQAQAAGVQVVRVSRCALGAVVVPHSGGTGIEAMPHSAVKARIALMLQILQADKPKP